MMTYLATFHTHFDAMKYIRFLKKRGISGTLKPVPRKVSSSCGTCAVFESPESVDVETFTKEDVEGFYLLEGDMHTLLYQDT